jgi:hypothetical protein
MQNRDCQPTDANPQQEIDVATAKQAKQMSELSQPAAEDKASSQLQSFFAAVLHDDVLRRDPELRRFFKHYNLTPLETYVQARRLGGTLIATFAITHYPKLFILSPVVSGQRTARELAASLGLAREWDLARIEVLREEGARAVFDSRRGKVAESDDGIFICFEPIEDAEGNGR